MYIHIMILRAILFGFFISLTIIIFWFIWLYFIFRWDPTRYPNKLIAREKIKYVKPDGTFQYNGANIELAAREVTLDGKKTVTGTMFLFNKDTAELIKKYKVTYELTTDAREKENLNYIYV